jgi:hypothetical protein
VKSSLLALLALSLMGCGDAVVDGACADGYEYCDRACRPIVACHPAAVAPDAGATDAVADSAPTDGCPPPPYVTAEYCGACDISCSGDTPSCKVQIDGTFACARACEEPQTYCAGSCVDLAVDPQNCGACGNVCPTGLCNGGTCRGASAGHVVVVGHDFVGAAPGLAVSRVITNAVFLANKNPVRVITFEQWADPAAVASVQSILDGASSASGRTYVKTVAANAMDFRDRLLIDQFDVALVFDQTNAPAGVLATIGSDTKGSLDSFSRVGGVVVVLDGGGGSSEMPSFLTASTMLGVSAHDGNTSPVDVVAPADAIGIGVHSPYSAPARSVTFTVSDPSSPSLITVVAEPLSAKPVVLHKVVFK